jgi:hypothetical protein
VNERARLRELERETREQKMELEFLKKPVCHEHGRQREVAEAVERGAVREMKDGWPFGAALRGEASNRPLLR